MRIARRIHLGVGLRHVPLFIDHVGDPPRVLVFRRIGGAVGQADLPVGVAEQGEVEAELFGEALVVGGGVEADAQDAGVLCGVLALEVPEPGTFLRSARGVGFRIEPEHDLLPAQVVQADTVAVVVDHVEIGSFIARLQHLPLSSGQHLKDSFDGHVRYCTGT